jgi:hypothetical protein
MGNLDEAGQLPWHTGQVTQYFREIHDLPENPLRKGVFNDLLA